ncbi:MAG: hypothetical protein ACRC6M_12460, partial [Microcystaceae cyanobacterium]
SIDTNPQDPQVEVIPDDPSLVPTANAETDSLRDANRELIEAIQTKAFEEAKKLGDFARKNYLDAVSNAREQVEKLEIFQPEAIEEAIQKLQTDVEQDWDGVTKQVTDFGDRLNEAAKSAWAILIQPKNKE